VQTPSPRLPLARMMFGNATLLSVVYLGIGLVAETVRRTTNARWAEWLCVAMDQLPAGALSLMRLMRPLRTAYVDGSVSEFWLHVVFGLMTVAIIFAMAVLVGVGMWIARALWERSRKARA